MTNRRLLAAATLVGLILTLILNYPGFLTWDSAAQLMQARSGRFVDWHPPIMSLLWRWADTIVSGPFGMLVLQTLLLWLGAYLIFRHMGLRSGPLASGLLLLFMFFPPVFSITGAIIKDVLMAACLLLAFGLIATFKSQPHSSSDASAPLGRYVLWGTMIVCLLFATAVRYNGVGAVFGAVAFLAYRVLGNRWKLPSRTGLALALAFPCSLVLLAASLGINRAITDVRTKITTAHEWHDLAGIMVQRDDFFIVRHQTWPTISQMFRAPAPSLDDIKELYDPGWGNSLGSTRPVPRTRNESLALRRLWLESITDHPGAYLKHRWLVIREVLGISSQGLRGRVIMTPVSASRYGDPEETKRVTGHDYRLSRVQVLLRRGLTMFASKTPLHRPYLYLMLASLCLVLAAARLRQDDIVMFLAISALAHESTLFVVASAAVYRYSYWLVLSAWLSFLLLLGGASDQRFASDSVGSRFDS